ncbi:MAG TPA: hypothetical protein VFJ95_18490, partial [Gammaproteobacteria bacterium]|nr:hypothetical protein [Gammaproteobacteria bacterium]
TVRVAPAPETEITLCVPSRTPEQAVPVLAAALGSAHDVSAAAFDPARGALLRIEGFAASVAARASALRELLAPAEVDKVDAPSSAALWREIGAATALASYPVVWRVSVPPSDAPRAVAALAPESYLLDWGGGLILAAYHDMDAARVRGAVHGGHATLLKAPASARREVPSFPPQQSALAALNARLKRAFDPDGKLNPGRME